MLNKVKGYTLIELLIVLVIIGLLASVAFPAYENSVSSSRRARAMATLEGIATGMERFFVSANTYAGAADGDDVPIAAVYNLATEDAADFYTFTAEDLTNRQYNLFAVPIEGTGQEDNGALTLTSTGIRGWDENNSDGDGYEVSW